MKRRTRRWLFPAAAVALHPVSWSAAPPAFAHEFTVVLVSDGSPKSRDARRGFQVAVDRSPDVSHAPGPDAGDHLGGVDVNLIPIDDGERAATVDRVGDLLDAGASAVVVLLVPSTADAVGAAAAERNKLALVLDDRDASGARTSLLLRPRDRTGSDASDVAAVAKVFGEAGEEPTSAALLGYDAGRLLDKVVGQLGDDLSPGEGLITAALAANADLASSRVASGAVRADPENRADRANTDDATNAEGAGIGTVAVIGAVAIAAGGGAVLITRRRVK